MTTKLHLKIRSLSIELDFLNNRLFDEYSNDRTKQVQRIVKSGKGKLVFNKRLVKFL